MGVMEFQAVVMAAGKGSRMTEITAGRPKCLLPLGNQPMLFYPLLMLERTGFQEAILIVLESVKLDFQTAIEQLDLKIRVDIVSIPNGEDWGTADSLRFVADKIKCDVIVVSCDLITDIDLKDMLHVFRKHQASLATLFFHPSSAIGTTVTPGPKSKHKPERDLVGLDKETSRLVFLASASDFEENVTMSRGLLRKHHQMLLYSRLLDSHLYVMRSWLCHFLVHEKSFSTIKGELLPYIVKKQLTKISSQKDFEHNTSVVAVDNKKDILQFAKESLLDLDIRSKSAYNDHNGDMKPIYHGDPIRCYGYLANSNVFGIRVNTLVSYCQMNARIMDQWKTLTGDRPLIRINPSSVVNSTQLGETCVVGEQSYLAERTSFKSSIIGAHCSIQTKVRLSNCIIMNNVNIGEGCVLTNCVVCDNVEIGSGADLKDCLIGSHHTVPPAAKHSNEVLTDIDRLMEI